MNLPVLIIHTSHEDIGVVYTLGQKYAEHNQLHSSFTWIRLGMLMKQYNLPIEAIVKIFIDLNEISDPELIMTAPENLQDLNTEVIEMIRKELSERG